MNLNKHKRIHKLGWVFIFIWCFSTAPVRAKDCDRAISEGKRWYSMAQEQLKQNPKAAEDFLLQAEKLASGCEYGDGLREDIYTAMGQHYLGQKNEDKAVEYLERARESGLNTPNPNSYPAVMLGGIYAKHSQADITFFPKALRNYKTALEIRNFSSKALAEQTHEKYKRLKARKGQIKEKLWKLAQRLEAEHNWAETLKAYKALTLMVRFDKKLIYSRNRAEFMVYLQQADQALTNGDSPAARKIIEQAKASQYYRKGEGSTELAKRENRLK